MLRVLVLFGRLVLIKLETFHSQIPTSNEKSYKRQKLGAFR